MLGFQTLSCLHEIPVIHSSTTKLQSVYSKAKDTSVLIRYPCDLAETIASKTLQVGLQVTAPFVKQLSAPVHAADKYAANKIREIESKYPVINTSVDDVMDSLNDKTEPIRNVINSVRDTTTSKIQHSKTTVSNAATATVNKASCAAGSLYSFYETHVPKFQRRSTQSALGLPWLRMLFVNLLLTTKQINDFFLRKISRKQYLTALPQRLLITVGTLLEFFIQKLRPENRTCEELRNNRSRPQIPNFVNRQGLKSNSYATSGANSRPRYANMAGIEESNGRLASFEGDEADYSPMFTSENNGRNFDDNTAALYNRLKSNDVEFIHSRFPADALLSMDNQEPSTDDDQTHQASPDSKKLNSLDLSEGGDDHQDQQ